MLGFALVNAVDTAGSVLLLWRFEGGGDDVPRAVLERREERSRVGLAGMFVVLGALIVCQVARAPRGRAERRLRSRPCSRARTKRTRPPPRSKTEAESRRFREGDRPDDLKVLMGTGLTTGATSLGVGVYKILVAARTRSDASPRRPVFSKPRSASSSNRAVRMATVDSVPSFGRGGTSDVRFGPVGGTSASGRPRPRSRRAPRRRSTWTASVR